MGVRQLATIDAVLGNPEEHRALGQFEVRCHLGDRAARAHLFDDHGRELGCVGQVSWTDLRGSGHSQKCFGQTVTVAHIRGLPRPAAIERPKDDEAPSLVVGPSARASPGSRSPVERVRPDIYHPVLVPSPRALRSAHAARLSPEQWPVCYRP